MQKIIFRPAQLEIGQNQLSLEPTPPHIKNWKVDWEYVKGNNAVLLTSSDPFEREIATIYNKCGSSPHQCDWEVAETTPNIQYKFFDIDFREKLWSRLTGARVDSSLKTLIQYEALTILSFYKSLSLIYEHSTPQVIRRTESTGYSTIEVDVHFQPYREPIHYSVVVSP